MKLPFLFSLVVSAAALTIAGCGGGGSTASNQDAVPVANQNTVPVANAGSAQAVVGGATVTLNAGGSSDADGDALTYVWALGTKPAGSAATLTGNTSSSPTFVADVMGTYVATLIVNDGKVDSAPASVTISADWKNADCSQTGTALPTCSVDFSDNDAFAKVVTESGLPAIVIATGTTPATTYSPNGDIYGNRAIFGLNLLDKVKLSEFPGLSYKMKLDSVSNTMIGSITNHYTVSLACDGNGYVNLITFGPVMLPSSADGNGYVTLTSAPDKVQWFKSGGVGKDLTVNGISLVNAINGANGNTPLSLTALIAAYPDACLYNFPQPIAGGISPQPAVWFDLGGSNNVTAYKEWIKDINIGTKAVF